MTESNNNTDVQAAAFIERWAASGASERANFQSFLNELCDLLDVSRPDPATEHPESDAYVFERPITFQHADGTASTNYIDLYRRNCFVLEAKQAVSAPDGEPALSQKHTQQRRKAGGATRGTGGWDTLMRRARNQAERYARALPAEEGRPPFLVVLDVGHAIELYSEFSRTGGNYVPYPDPASHRIALEDLAQEATRDRLRLLWTDPESLDPSRHSAAVTRDIAQRLARLARSLEQDRRPPEYVAAFLMRCLFTMFAEDVGLLPRQGFQELLESLRDQPQKFAPMAETLWRTMKHGGFSGILREDLLHFNGRFFDHTDAIPLTADQLELLIEAANADWSDVEPAIFGTLLERALDPRERHKLGAHYTPRAYVERLVMPTIIEPLREEWASVEAAAEQYREAGDEKKAIAEISAFHDRLCHVRVLDPACGSGNFLYVTLEHLKRLEGEVLEALKDFGQSGKLDLAAVSPEQFLGLEINPRAAAIAELVLWIGHLQWHFRTRGNVTPSLPVIKDFDNIECRDAVLDYDEERVITDEAGRPVTHWDGRTTKLHPVTGKEVPDESAQAISYEYINPRPAHWPAADFVVGNPPFVGNKRMREVLGGGYVEALRSSYPQVPGSADLVMYWWHKAALLARDEKIERFGLITTNSFTQTFNRRVAEHHMSGKNPVSLVFAVPDHPWVDTTDGAAVRICMTVGTSGLTNGTLQRVAAESAQNDDGSPRLELFERNGRISPDLSVGPDLTLVMPLKANESLSFQGCKLVGSGFQVAPDVASNWIDEYAEVATILKEYWAGRDVTQSRNPRYVIDLFGLTLEQARSKYPQLYQHLRENVKPFRDNVRERSQREAWWLFARSRPALRAALSGLQRYIVTSEVSKHRFFARLTWPTDLIDGSLIGIALEDPYFLGVLSSQTHVCWALAAGGTLEDRPRYNNSICFDTFPFPDATTDQQAHIRDLAEQLDKHRKRQQAAHEKLTLTGMYNVVEKLKTGEALTAKEKTINEQGLCEVLLDLHRELDAAVIEAYGWPADIGEDEILARLVALNAERGAEEARGQVRWLRPDYQAPEGEQAQAEVGLETTMPTAQPARGKQAWPKELPLRARAVQQALRGLPGPGSSAEVSALFKGGRNREQQIAELLETLAALGQVRPVDESRYAVN